MKPLDERQRLFREVISQLSEEFFASHIKVKVDIKTLLVQMQQWMYKTSQSPSTYNANTNEDISIGLIIGLGLNHIICR